MNRSILACFLALSLLIQLLLLYAPFDVYYSSPLIPGLQPQPISNTNGNAPAARLVFFSADGLRASSFYAHPGKSPYLHSLMGEGRAAWGQAHSHVPTESRPGHVAMMAGFTEDVSAVAAGWRRNPVPFDSTIRAARRSWLWGSPDIVQPLAEGIPYAVYDCYSPEEEDFASQSAEKLDEWVFERVEKFLSKPNQKAGDWAEHLNGDRTILFLHLLGLDTNGHGHKPTSRKYLDNIAVVDRGVEKIVKAVEERFKDGRTAYLFTSDHGMTDWGSHGDGSDDETQVPFIAWGSGVRPSSQNSLAQVDLAPLQAALLGTAVPTNSQGVLPMQLLNASGKYLYQAASANLRQMAEQYRSKREERVANSLPLAFRDCPHFSIEAVRRVESEIARLAAQGRFEAAATASLRWVPKVREALLYFHRYHRGSQGAAITALFLTWNCTIYAMVTRSATLKHLNLAQVFLPSRRLWLLLFSVATLLRLQRFNWINFLYYLLPIYVGWLAVRLQFPYGMRQVGQCVTGILAAMRVRSVLIALVSVNIGLATLGAFVSVFHDRRLLSVIYLCLAPVWFLEPQRRKSLDKWRLLFLTSSLLLAIFPLLHTVGQSPNRLLVAIAPIIYSALLACHYVFKVPSPSNRGKYSQELWLIGLHLASFLVSLLSPWLSTPIRIFSWATLPASFAVPISAGRVGMGALLLWAGSLAVPYTLMAVAYESIFLLVYTGFLVSYATLELRHTSSFSSSPDANFTLVECRRAFFLLALIAMGFFGTGNIASLSSFDPRALQNFLSVFSPFTMAALLIAKISIPFMQMALTFAYIVGEENRARGGARSGSSRELVRLGDSRALLRLSSLMMLLTNTMALAFFFQLREEGSWLDIGLSISNYVISMLSACICFLLLHLARLMMKVGLGGGCVPK